MPSSFKLFPSSCPKRLKSGCTCSAQQHLAGQLSEHAIVRSHGLVNRASWRDLEEACAASLCGAGNHYIIPHEDLAQQGCTQFQLQCSQQ
jgi:hypothetical protein